MSAQEVLRLARTRGVMIATAESCTGGMVAAALTDIPGSSAVVDRGFVTYSNAAKQDMLGVRCDTLDTYGAVSQETAAEMADGALAQSDAGLAVAITGIAGPGGSDTKPEGMVCFAIAQKGQPTQAETVQFGAQGRAIVRRRSRDHALDLLKTALSQ